MVPQVTDQFDVCFDRLMGIEGAYSDGEGDPGGETNWGLSKRSYPDLDIKGLTREQARAIYRRDFWEAGRMAQFDAALVWQVFDFAVNGGIQTAFRKLQRAVGVADDGWIGKVTTAALKAMPVADVIMRFAAERLDFLTRLENWPQAGKGWARRIAKDLRYGAEDTP
jgi:lysozyme family protein